MKLRTPIARVKGLGSAKEGVSHWWMQRLTALALVPLTLWFCFSVASLSAADYATIVAWIKSPLTVSLLAIVIVTTFYHAYLGMQVVMEDYVGSHAWRTSLIILLGFLAVALSVMGVFALLRIFFGS